MSYAGNTPDDRQPECVSPNRLIGQRILDIDESEYACMPQTELNETMTHSVNEGENFVIECNITADPSPDLHWLTPDHTELFPNTNQIPFIVDSESTLTIIRIRKEDDGTYSCTGTNAAGTLNIRNVVNVVGTGNAPILKTDPHLQSSTTITSQQSEPLKGDENSTLVISIAVVAFLIILVVVVVIVAVILRRNGDDRYTDTDTLQRQPTTSVFDPPSHYSTIPLSPNDDIYQEIKHEDDLYEKPREPGDMSPASIRPDHTYMAHVLRQDSFVSNESGGVPAGYERSMVRDVGKPKSDTSSTPGSDGGSDRPANGAQRNIYVATNDRKGNNRQSNVEHNEMRNWVPDLHPEAKAMYANIKRT
ncbi:leucine-rich repeat and immunoglobulin-like domain-containing nogo receptor-interacting protein 2 [Strongylocentrotus purpuratus]|uniref:Ig-like domain-containing protein n=1 Tax=Strongylocentrotus purpuratus TaxID=7668 RepID=A0A7M7NPD5_STRPU|nr:leucine-rich repeat and immunoglobulin-like domain-containing nogo receptor-interacting protein 2 [Strongylocentrotus purpuratus]